MLKSTNCSFSFKTEELATKLTIANKEVSNGYWHYQAEKSTLNQNSVDWFLGVSQGKIVYSGIEKLSWKSFLKIIVRYTPGLRSSIKKAILSLDLKLNPTRRFCLTKMVKTIERTTLITKEQALNALELKILADFDIYLFASSGSFRFYPQSPFVTANSEIGFDLQKLIERAKQRRILWHRINKYIPSLDIKPIINSDRVSKSQLTPLQKQRLHAILKRGKSLKSIASSLGKDNLEIAKLFAPLIHHGLVTIFQPATAVTNNRPKIVLVDDSPLLTKQFQSLVTKWGYQFKSCNDPICAVETIANYNPEIIFIDINMPGVSGFDLVKLIRKKSQIASIPMVILTSENKLSNKWRANWSNCKFLIKPIAIERINLFKKELRSVLNELAPISNRVAVA